MFEIANFDKSSKSYDQASEVQSYAWELLEPFLTTVSPEGVGSVLDIGCATGRHTQWLARYFFGAAISGVDQSEAMIAYANAVHGHPRITYCCADVRSFCHSEVDVLVSNAACQWLGHPRVLDEIKTKWVPRSPFFVTLFGEATFEELSVCMQKLGQPALPAQSFGWVNVRCRLMRQHRVVQVFDTLRDFFYSMRRTGVTLQAHRIWTPSFFRQLETLYVDLYGAIRVTHQIFVGEWTV